MMVGTEARQGAGRGHRPGPADIRGFLHGFPVARTLAP